MLIKGKELRYNLLQHVFIILVFGSVMFRLFGIKDVSELVQNWLQLPGLPIILFGMWLKWSNDQQAIKRIIYNQLKGKEELITTGWYRFSRNPCYLSQAMVTGGALICLPSAFGLLAFMAFLIAVNVTISVEEKRLQELFGQRYEGYKRVVGRWFLTPMQLMVLRRVG